MKPLLRKITAYEDVLTFRQGLVITATFGIITFILVTINEVFWPLIPTGFLFGLWLARKTT